MSADPAKDSDHARTSRMVVGVIAGPGFPEKLIAYLLEHLPAVLQERLPGASWRVVIRTEEFAGPGADVDLPQLARRMMLEEGWDLAVCLTARPLRVGRRPVTAEASTSLGVGVISLPALGAIGLSRRLLEAVLLNVEAMLRTRARGDRASRRRDQRQRIEDLCKLSSALGRPLEEAPGKIAFATATAIGNLRLLLGAIRGNRPWALTLGLSRSLIAALGTSAFGLTSPVIWRMSNAMHGARMAMLMIASLLAIGFTFMAAHNLWERVPTHTPTRVARSRVVLINFATFSTVVIGVLTTYVALLASNFVFGAALIPATVLQAELHRPVAAIQYLRVAWLVSSLATLGGALGAVLEKNAAARAAAYCIRPVTNRDSTRARAEATTELSASADPRQRQ